MRRLAMVVAVGLGVVGAAPSAFAETHGLPDWVRGESAQRVNTTRTTSGGRTMVCEVWQDYTFNADTGAFIDWQGDPYVTNCVEVGDGVGDEDDCAPGDVDCGDPEPSCKLGKPCTNPPPLPGPRKTCAECKSAYQRAMDQIADKQLVCVLTWGMVDADAQCRRGLTRRGYNPGLAGFIQLNGGPHWCIDGFGGTDCVTIPAYTECMKDFVNGFHETVVSGPGEEVAITLDFVPTDMIVQGSGTYTHSQPGEQITLPAGTGYNDKCRDHFAPDRNKAMAASQKCEKNAKDRPRGGVCPLPQQAPPGSSPGR